MQPTARSREVFISGGYNRSSRRTIENSTLFGSNLEPGNLIWEGVNDFTTSGNGIGDIENGRQVTSIPCWCRSSGVKGTARSSNPGWEKERVDRGSKEKPIVVETR